MNNPNANYETNLALASAIYDALCDWVVIHERDVPYMRRLQGESKAFEVTPFERLPKEIRDELYDLAVGTVQKATALKA